jgi:hypothetical protein
MSKAFWNKVYKQANANFPKEYELCMDDPITKKERGDLPANAEARIFSCVYKDGKKYSKGMFYTKKQIGNEDPSRIAFLLVKSFANLFDKIEAENGKSKQES